MAIPPEPIRDTDEDEDDYRFFEDPDEDAHQRPPAPDLEPQASPQRANGQRHIRRVDGNVAAAVAAEIANSNANNANGNGNVRNIRNSNGNNNNANGNGNGNGNSNGPIIDAGIDVPAFLRKH
jgi:hypothetical protein